MCCSTSPGTVPRTAPEPKTGEADLSGRLRGVLANAPTEGRPGDERADVRDTIARPAPEQAELVRLIPLGLFFHHRSKPILRGARLHRTYPLINAREDLRSTLATPAARDDGTTTIRALR